MVSDCSRLQNMVKTDRRASRSTRRDGAMVGSIASNFADLVVVGERMELGIRRGKLAKANSNKLPLEKRKGVGPNPHCLHETGPSIARVEARGGNALQTSSNPVSEKLRHQCQVSLPWRERRPCHRKMLEPETQGPRSFRWWFAQFPKSRAECVKQPSPSPRGAVASAISHENRERAEIPNRRGEINSSTEAVAL
ncbi:hypothetical protein CR513_21894, partial [Mucuna pruriens]